MSNETASDVLTDERVEALKEDLQQRYGGDVLVIEARGVPDAATIGLFPLIAPFGAPYARGRRQQGDFRVVRRVPPRLTIPRRGEGRTC